MFDLIATVLAWFYNLVPDYAAAIALLTLSVMVLLTPLTLKGTKSMIQMQRLAPEIKKIQQQYRGDRQKLNEETLKFYQEHKINPLGGCLPLLLQMPVFIVLYRVLHKLTETGPDGTFRPSYISPDSRLYRDLVGETQMLSFGLDLSHSAARELGDSFVGGLPYLLLVLAVTATSYYQQRQISARNTGTQVNPQQQMLMRVMPAFFAVISLTLPAGLVVYFLVSNLYRIGQQAYITRKLYAPSAKEGPIETTAAEVEKGGKGTTGRAGKAAVAEKPSDRPTPSSRRRGGDSSRGGQRSSRGSQSSAAGGSSPRPQQRPSRVTPKGGGARPTPQGPPRRKKK